MIKNLRKFDRKACFQFAFGVIILSGLFGCTSSKGHNFDSNHVQNISLNSTNSKDIKTWFGEPFRTMVKETSGFETEIYNYAFTKQTMSSAGGRFLIIELKDSIVNGYNFKSSFLEDTTDFDSNNRKSLKIEETKTPEVIRILGNPNGKIQLPTNMVPRKYIDAAPENSSEVWVYSHFTGNRKGGLTQLHIKELILYFNSSGLLVHTKFIEGDKDPKR